MMNRSIKIGGLVYTLVPIGINGTRFILKLSDRVLGFLEKYKDTCTETHPWKAYGARYSAHQKDYVYDHGKFDCFYGRDGVKQAIQFLVR